MVHPLIDKCSKAAGIAVLSLTLLSSCIKDDLDSCPSQVKLKFDYTYNVKDADAFSAEVKNLNVYVFDQDGKYYDTYVESASKFKTGHTMSINNLPSNGKYTFVCLARNKQYDITRADDTDDEMEFTFTQLTPGVSTMADLQEEMGKKGLTDGFTNNTNFTALYTGKTSVDYKDGQSTESEISLMKCTKTYRVVLLPQEKDQEGFELENFSVKIDGSAALLDCEGNKVENKAITYEPYNSETRTNTGDYITEDDKNIDKALVYDLSSSRMFERSSDGSSQTRTGSSYDDKRIIITDKRNGKELFNHSLPWFLALCGEHTETSAGESWGDQEYLDRQDHYALVFYVPDANTSSDYKINARIQVNGWVLNLQDTDLQ